MESSAWKIFEVKQLIILLLICFILNLCRINIKEARLMGLYIPDNIFNELNKIGEYFFRSSL